ncbi:NAD(P)-dependent oxidoreductase [Mycoplasmatota bacterium]|nr:NAD(P)-dependent oxidoreductase [Mycoplasmatota bacterium]
MKRILLTGATGSIGVQALRELCERKNLYETIIFDKKTDLSVKTLEPFKKYIKIIYGDIRDKQTLIEAVKEVDFVLHFAAVIPPLADYNQKLAYEVNVNGTKNLVLALKEYSPNAFLLYSSSVSVYGDRLEGEDIHINDPLIPSVGDYYAETKIKAEKIVSESGLRYSIFRLSGVMGPRPGQDNKKIDPIFFHMPLRTRIEIVTTRDVGYGVVKAIEKEEELNGNIYNFAGGKKCQIIYYNFLKRVFGELGINIDHFPKYSFAEQNFHCGYYKDSDVLNDILHFQRDDIDSYFEWTKPKVNPLTKLFYRIFSRVITKKLAKESDVLNAMKHNNKHLIKRFFREYLN